MQASGVHEGVVDSQEKADELVLEVHRKAEQLRSCLVMLEQCLSRSSAADPALASKLSGELEVFIEEIQKLFVKVQSFEGGLYCSRLGEQPLSSHLSTACASIVS